MHDYPCNVTLFVPSALGEPCSNHATSPADHGPTAAPPPPRRTALP